MYVKMIKCKENIAWKLQIVFEKTEYPLGNWKEQNYTAFFVL